MRRVSIIMAIAMALTAMTASVALAGSPTCENYENDDPAVVTEWKNHGEHVTSGYATPGEPGGARGGPAHFGNHPLSASPGATFCGPGNNQAPELLHIPNGNVITHPAP